MNNQIFYYLYSFVHTSTVLDQVIIFCAVYLPYIIIGCALSFLFLYRKSIKEVVLVFATGGVAWVAATVLKNVIHAERPLYLLTKVHPLFVETGYSFPSGHATFFAGLAFAIFFKHKKAGYVFMLAAFIIGVARVAGGVHFPIDIVGGYILGFLVAFLVKTI